MGAVEEVIQLKGESICGGIVEGAPFVFCEVKSRSTPDYPLSKGEVKGEVERYLAALDQAKGEISLLQTKLETEGADEGALILGTHVQLLSDPMLVDEIVSGIKQQKRNAEAVLQEWLKGTKERFYKLDDPLFRDRFRDIVDVVSRIMECLGAEALHSLSSVPQGSIVFARDLVPSDIAELSLSAVEGLVTEKGGETSHVAIMAKARGIPYIVHIPMEEVTAHNPSYAALNGDAGEVVLDPDPSTLEHYREERRERLRQHKKREEASAGEALTSDGCSISLMANIELMEDIELMQRYHGKGMGLFRSESLVSLSGKIPSEQEQYKVYRQLAQATQPLPAVIRVFDIGGDKLPHPEETNPFLGCRAIRFLLQEKAIFKKQLRALLRAAVYGNLRILLPMISHLDELRQTKELISEVVEDLRSTRYRFTDSVPVGCMIEVPSAALICDALARECDFLSIGTNDLVQYALAVERGNKRMQHLYNPQHPSVLKLIQLVVAAGKRYSIPVSICGEMAANPEHIPLLLGLGVQELSVAARHIPMAKEVIRQTKLSEAQTLVANCIDFHP